MGIKSLGLAVGSLKKSLQKNICFSDEQIQKIIQAVKEKYPSETS